MANALQQLMQYDSGSDPESEVVPGSPRKVTSGQKLTKRQRTAAESKDRKRKEHHVIQNSCEDCLYDCRAKIDLERQQLLNESYWELSSDGQKHFIKKCVTRLETKRRRVHDVAHRKQCSYQYMLSDSQFTEQQVCAAFFLNTIGYGKQSSNIITRALSKDVTAEETTEQRGSWRRNQYSKLHELVEADIASYNPDVSHHRREHAPNVKYLPSDLSAKSMYTSYMERTTDEAGKCTYQFYCAKLKAKHVKFTKLGQEECEVCEEQSQHETESGHECVESAEADTIDCTQCRSWALHKTRSRASREEYSRDKVNQKALVMSVDLQKVIQIPRMEGFKAVLFTTRMNVFNQTFAPVGGAVNGSVYGFVWDDATCGRKSEDIMSCFIRFLRMEKEKKHIVLWLDNCTSQNKNWNLFLAMILLVNSALVQTNVIEFKYFEPGHTFMSADSFHHSVERRMKAQDRGHVLTTDDFFHCVNTAQQNAVSVRMDASDFCSCELECKQPTKKRPRPLLNTVKYVKFVRGSYDFTYGEDFSGKTTSCNLFTRDQLRTVTSPNFDFAETLHYRSTPCGIESSRLQAIKEKIVPLLPPEKKMFWHTLPESTTN